MTSAALHRRLTCSLFNKVPSKLISFYIAIFSKFYPSIAFTDFIVPLGY
jgi:hypothetical protein